MPQRFPFSPFPSGWFFVCYTHELPPGRLFSKAFMGREIVAFRGAEGSVTVADAHCPHLGAHLGKGGTVADGCVRCPFHGFRFAGDGRCVATPYGEPPKQARLRTWATHEAGGFVFAWFHPRDTAPTWQLPDMPLDGYGPLKTHHVRLRGHPQETTENGVDPGHLQVVHGYHSVTALSPLRIDGPYLTGAYAMRRDAGVFRFLDLRLESEFRVHVWGLGYSHVQVCVPHYGIYVRQWIFSTPSDGEYVDLHISCRVQSIAHPERVFPGLQHAPAAFVTGLMHTLVMKVFENDIGQDFDIWEHKIFVPRPALAKGDGPIGLFRRYCRQFYDDTAGEALSGDAEPGHDGSAS